MNNYAVELANIYERAKTRPHTRLKVTNTLILSVLVDVEIFRAKRAMTLLKDIGIPFKRQYVDDWLEVTGYHGILDGHKHGLEIGAHYDDPAFYMQPLRTKQKLAA